MKCSTVSQPSSRLVQPHCTYKKKTTIPILQSLFTSITISIFHLLLIQQFSKMKGFTALAAALIGVASGQVTNLTSLFTSAPIPTPPPGSQSDVAQLISAIPACWTPCVGGAIEEVCPSDDSWTCACNAYFDTTASDFIQLAAYDAACQQCSQNVGPSDGGEQGP
jgi:hypothetical protein